MFCRYVHHGTREYPGGSRRGVALVVAVAVLTVLALLAVSFARFMSLERSATKVVTDTVHARMTAEAGLEEARARLLNLAREGRFGTDKSWQYLGEDHNRDSSLSLYEDIDLDGVLDLETTPLALALAPSFPLDENHDGSGDLLMVGNGAGGFRQIGISGLLPATYEEGSGTNSYSLEVRDLSGLLNVNQGPRHDPAAMDDLKDPRNRSAIQIFNTLGETLGTDPDLGLRLVSGRSAGGYRSMGALETAIGTVDAGLIESCITFHAWVDETTMGSDPDMASHRHAPGNEQKPGLMEWFGLSPFHMIEDPRAPVNINTAPRPVLIALLAGLEAWNWVDYLGAGAVGGVPFINRVGPIGITEAGVIADLIIDYRRGISGPHPDAQYTPGAFSSWHQFNEFVDLYVKNYRGSGITSIEDAALLKANFNPNTDLNKFNPNAVMWRPVDKSDVKVFTTEFCFRPTGYFEVSSIGRITEGQNGEILAHCEIRTAMRLYEIYRASTQADFEAAGHIKSAHASPWVRYSTINDQTVDTYPESDRHGPGSYRNIDGQIALATVESIETPDNSSRLNFRASFNGMGPSNQTKWVYPNYYSRLNGFVTTPPSWSNYTKYNNDNSIFAGPPSIDPSDPKNFGNVVPDGCYMGGHNIDFLECALLYPAENAAGIDGDYRLVTSVFWMKLPVSSKIPKLPQEVYAVVEHLATRGPGASTASCKGGYWALRNKFSEIGLYKTGWMPHFAAVQDYPLISTWRENSQGGRDWYFWIDFDPSEQALARMSDHQWVLVCHTMGYDCFPRYRIPVPVGGWNFNDFLQASAYGTTASGTEYYQNAFKSLRWFWNTPDDYDSLDFANPLNVVSTESWAFTDYNRPGNVFAMTPLYSAPNLDRGVWGEMLHARATVDEMKLYDGLFCDITDPEIVPGMLPGIMDLSEYYNIFYMGRYYNDTEPARYTSAELPFEARQILSLEWTAWIPGTGVTTYGNPYQHSLEVRLQNGANTFGPYSGEGSEIQVRQDVSGPVRFLVDFVLEPATSRGQGILETPFFDDITIYYLPERSAGYLAYEIVIE